MGIDHSIKHRKISRVALEATLHQSITLLEKEKKKGINNRKETMLIMLIDRHIHFSKVVINPPTHFSWLTVYVCLCIEDRHGNKVFT
jgi:hypothetical protein